MITRHHVVLALICSLIIGGAIAGFDPVLVFIMATGTVIGVLLPDIQMSRPKKTCFRTIAWHIVQAGKIACIPLMCGSYRAMLGITIEPDDKRLTHSLPGVAWYFVILAGILCAPVLIFNLPLPVGLLVFLGGLFLGLVLHLIEDLCTRKGISVFFPFSEHRIKGSIRPCDLGDPRIRRFQIQHCSILVILFVFLATGTWPAGVLIASGFAGFSVCIGSMILQSDVRIEYGAGGNSAPREAIAA